MPTAFNSDQTRRAQFTIPHRQMDHPDSPVLSTRREPFMITPESSPRLHSGPLMPDEDEIYKPEVSPSCLTPTDRTIQRRRPSIPSSAAGQWTAVQTGRPVMHVFAQQHAPPPPARDLHRTAGPHARQLSADAPVFQPKAPVMHVVPLPGNSPTRRGSRSLKYPDSPPPTPPASHTAAPQRNTPALRLHNELGKLHKVRDIRYQQNPDHWVAVISVDGRDCGVGCATGKKEAEQRAAMAALQHLRIPYPC